MRKVYLTLSFVLMLAVCLQAASASFFPQQELTNYTLTVLADNATGCNLTSIQYPDNTVSPFLNVPMSQNGQTFTYVLNGNNFTKPGNTCMFYTCTDPFATPTVASGSTCVIASASGQLISTVQVSVYIFFLLFCLTLTYLSVRLIYNNPYAQDKLTAQQQYALKERDNFNFYLHLMRKKFWIVGVFGVYLSFFLFTTILNNLVLNLGLQELNILLIYLNNVLAWGLIPFVLFWFGYILIYFYKTTEETLKYQFGGFPRE